MKYKAAVAHLQSQINNMLPCWGHAAWSVYGSGPHGLPSVHCLPPSLALPEDKPVNIYTSTVYCLPPSLAPPANKPVNIYTTTVHCLPPSLALPADKPVNIYTTTVHCLPPCLAPPENKPVNIYTTTVYCLPPSQAPPADKPVNIYTTTVHCLPPSQAPPADKPVNISLNLVCLLVRFTILRYPQINVHVNKCWSDPQKARSQRVREKFRGFWRCMSRLLWFMMKIEMFKNHLNL